MTLRGRAARYLADAFRGVRRAPVEVIATLCIALTFSWALELGDSAMQSWAEVAVACALLIAVAWTGTLLHALGTWDAPRRWVFTIGGAFVIAIYALAVQDFQYTAEHWRAVLLVAAAVLWLIALPAFARRDGSLVERMRRVDGRILLRMIGALLYGAALFAGLALALRAIDVLFELSLDGEIYGHVWAWIFFVLVPWIVLGGIEDYVRPLEQTNVVAGVAQRIALFLVPPLLALYYLILYAYVVRIFVTGEIPKNLVSPMVLAAAGLGALALLLFDPRPAGGGIARWLRLAPPLFLPLAPLGAWALLVRIDQYGWTEFRVIRLLALGALAGLAVAATVQLVRRRPFALHLAPLSLAALLLLGAIGPWSALALSRRSQHARLVSALERVDVPPQDSTYAATRTDTAAAPRIIDGELYEQIRSSAQYLAGHFGADALPPVLHRLAARAEGPRWLDYAAELGLQADRTTAEGRFALGGSLPYSTPLQLQSGTAYRVEWMGGERAPDVARQIRDARGGAWVTLHDSTQVALHIAERVLYADMTALVDVLRRTAGTPRGSELPPAQAVLPVTDTTGAEQGQLVVWHLWAESDSAGLQIGRLEGLVVVQ